jgi:hypothetical protein
VPAGNSPDTTIPVVKGSGSITASAIINAYIKNLTNLANQADTPVQYVYDNVGDTQGMHVPCRPLRSPLPIGALADPKDLAMLARRAGELHRQDL